jgi:uncharacterized Zn-binding protein involved in type VI secretion
MKRFLLKLGDKSTNGGVVTEGAENFTHHGTPVTFIGAKVWCGGCKSEGFIGERGPRRIATMKGKQQALDGDICVCKCTPPPIMLASQNTAWHAFNGHEVADQGYVGNDGSMTSEYRGEYDERVRVVDADGRALSGTPYHIRTSGGKVYKGLTDSAGYCPRIYTNDTNTLDIAVGVKALERWT